MTLNYLATRWCRDPKFVSFLCILHVDQMSLEILSRNCWSNGWNLGNSLAIFEFSRVFLSVKKGIDCQPFPLATNIKIIRFVLSRSIATIPVLSFLLQNGRDINCDRLIKLQKMAVTFWQQNSLPISAKQVVFKCDWGHLLVQLLLEPKFYLRLLPYLHVQQKVCFQLLSCYQIWLRKGPSERHGVIAFMKNAAVTCHQKKERPENCS